jgi:signal transduction histidine kinase
MDSTKKNSVLIVDDEISHEIRTPLDAVFGAPEIQLRNEKLPKNIKEQR